MWYIYNDLPLGAAYDIIDGDDNYLPDELYPAVTFYNPGVSVEITRSLGDNISENMLERSDVYVSKSDPILGQWQTAQSGVVFPPALTLLFSPARSRDVRDDLVVYSLTWKVVNLSGTTLTCRRVLKEGGNAMSMIPGAKSSAAAASSSSSEHDDDDDDGDDDDDDRWLHGTVIGCHSGVMMSTRKAVETDSEVEEVAVADFVKRVLSLKVIRKNGEDTLVVNRGEEIFHRFVKPISVVTDSPFKQDRTRFD